MRARFTKEQAKQHLDAWVAAELALSTGQSYTIGKRSLTRVNLAEVMRQIKYWQHQLDLAEGRGTRKTKRIIPIDL